MNKKYIGVELTSNGTYATIVRINSKRIYISRFSNPDAAVFRDYYIRCNNLNNYLNFPDYNYPMTLGQAMSYKCDRFNRDKVMCNIVDNTKPRMREMCKIVDENK